VRLGDIAKTASGGTPKRTSPSFYGGNIPWVKSGELGDSTVYETEESITEAGLKGSSAKVFPKGTLCVALYGATVGKLGVLGMDAATNQAVCGIFLPPELDTRFAYRFLESKRRELIEMGKGGAQPNISQEIIRDLQFPLPPLDEQREIVAEIEKQFTRLEAGVGALKRVQANLKRYRAAVLKAACEGKLVPTEAEIRRSEVGDRKSYETGEQLLQRILTERRANWTGRGKYKEPTAPDTTNLPELPVGWIWATLDAVAAIKGGVTKDQKRKFTEPVRSIPYLRVANVQRGHLDLSEVKEIVTTEGTIQELLLQCGDILFNEGGDRDKLGRGWVWNDELPECIHQNHVFRARLFNSELNPKLVSWYANTFGQKFFFDEGKHTTNLASISMSKLKGLPIPIPPAAEQKRIVEEVERRLSVIDEMESTVSANLQRATRLRQSILQKAFAGELST
jgi:type I restriction enzyme S subunit